MENLTAEDRILGRTEPKPKTNLEKKAFTSETKYIVKAEGNNNEKVVDGTIIGAILSLENKKLITSGENTIFANGLVITRIEEQKEEIVSKMETVEELPKPKKKRVK